MEYWLRESKFDPFAPVFSKIVLTTNYFMIKLKDLNYMDFIESIIKENRGLESEKGFEIHHILPKSLGGTNDSYNLVKLTYFEHVIAHYLLARDTDELNMYRAFVLISGRNFSEFSKDEIKKLTEEDLIEIARLREYSIEKHRKDMIENPLYYRPGVLEKIRENNIKRWDPNNEEYANFREFTLNRLKQQAQDPDFQERVSKSVKNYFDNNFEARKNLSDKHKLLWKNPEYKAKMSLINKDKKCYNNGINNIYLKEGEPVPEGYQLGDIKKGKKNWWTKGEVSILSEECPGEGYVPGKFSEVRIQKEKDLQEKQNNASTLVDELKYKVNIPLSNLRKDFKKGKVTEEEMNLKEKEIYTLREEILSKYGR